MDARHYNAPPAAIAALEKKISLMQAIPPFYIWEENELALEVFLELAGQWLFAPDGYMRALDGQVLLAYLSLLDEPPARQRQLYRSVQMIADGAADTWRKQAATMGSDRGHDDEVVDDDE